MPTFQKSLIESILWLRSISILIQLLILFFVTSALNYELPVFWLLTIVLLETIFNGICFYYRKIRTSNAQGQVLTQLLADIIFLGFLLFFSGGATNAFISLLLIPIAIAAVTLPTLLMVIILSAAALTYTILLVLMPMHIMHGNMEGHFIGMWINFIFSAAIAALVISKLAKRMQANELLVAKYREEQLKQEQVMALGVASAQVTHDLATPIASLQLLFDELEELASAEVLSKQEISELTHLMKKEVSRCAENLHQFRAASQCIKNGDKLNHSLTKLQSILQSYCALTYPNNQILFSEITSEFSDNIVESDSTLLPALMNIINNAVEASLNEESNRVEVSFEVIKQNINNAEYLIIAIKDYGKGFSQENLSHLGQIITTSKGGLGLAMLLSNASIERLQGEITLENHNDGACVFIKLPCRANENLINITRS